MHFELWDTEAGNLLYDFDALDEAFEAARELTARNPGRYPDLMALGQAENDSTVTWLARGRALLNMTAQRPAV